MGWGTSYIDTEGYLNRICANEIDDRIAECEEKVKSAFDLMTTIMASSPMDFKPGEGEEPIPWPQYIKENRDYIEEEIRECLPKLERLRVAKIAAERKEAEVQYCANGHGHINNEWDGVLKCPVCDSPFVGSCKIKLVESD